MITLNRLLNNQQIADLFKSVSAAYEIKGENKFRIIAYDRAATAIEHLSSEVKDLWDEKKLDLIPGIGPNIASHLDELFKTGKVRHFELILKGLPEAMFELIKVPGIGAKTAYRLCREFKLDQPQTVVNRLISIAKKNQISSLEGFGEISQADILRSLVEFKAGQVRKKRMVLPYADEIAQKVISFLLKNKSVAKADLLGSLRRRVSTVGDIDIAVATNNPVEVIDWFIKYPLSKRTIEKGPSGASILLANGHQVDLRVQKPEAYGAMLQYFIGSKQHNIHLRELALKKGYSLSEHGIKPTIKIKSEKLKVKNYNLKLKLFEFEDEEKFYNFLELPWIPPELREDTGEIEAALRQSQGKPNGLPNLIQLGEIKGDLHVHSNFQIEPSHDLGESSMKEMAKRAIELKYQYLAFNEHNPSISNHSEKNIINILKRKSEAIEQLRYSLNKASNLKILNGLEIDILPNGKLAIPEKCLNYLDFAIASVHSSFGMNREKMTERILIGLNHPKVTIFGHPTGRKLNYREGYELEWDKIFSFCRKRKIFLEINAWPDRLDLTESIVKEAVENRIKMVINTDSHNVEQMDLMKYGVYVARRGWAEKKDILNCLDYDKMMREIT